MKGWYCILIFMFAFIMVAISASALPPVISDEIPVNGTISVEQSPDVQVNISDPDGDPMNITISTNHTDLLERVDEIYVDVGDHIYGTVNSTYVVDGDVWRCDEVVGAPGYRLLFNFTTSEIPNDLYIYALYDGNLAHIVNVEMYNFSSSGWTTLGQIIDGVSYSWVNLSIPDPSNHTFRLNTRIRLDHASPGNVNHKIYIDEIGLNDTWYSFAHNESLSNTTYSVNFALASQSFTDYYWSVYLEDGTNNTSVIFDFRTGWCAFPVISNVQPSNGTTDVGINPAIGIRFDYVFSHGGIVNITFWENSTGTWVGIQIYNTTQNGSFWSYYGTADHYLVEYNWRITTEHEGDVIIFGPYGFQTTSSPETVLSSTDIMISGVIAALVILVILVALSKVMGSMGKVCG